MKKMELYDVIIIGAGVIGMAVAYEFLERDKSLKILILEKEDEVAQHASGRNSGVLHAGFYYGESSLKAKFCVEGNALMKDFCRSNNLKLNENRKIVVAKDAAELEGLRTLYQRGLANGVKLKLIDEDELKVIEPNIKTYQKAMLSPSTATVDPIQVCLRLKDVLIEKGVEFKFSEKVKKVDQNVVQTIRNRFPYKFMINAAGMYALGIAKKMGVKTNYVLLPFKGVYLKIIDPVNVATNVYPVPDLKFPFLGVHVTVTADNDQKLGPTAIPAFWYEQYQGLQGFSLKELSSTLWGFGALLIKNTANITSLAIREIKNYQKKTLLGKVSGLLFTAPKELKRHPAGIRAQLFDKKKKSFVNDFIIEKRGGVCHILNAVSPGFTCSFSFAKHIVNQFDLREIENVK